MSNGLDKPVYCPRRHGIECETPNACAGGCDCRMGPDLAAMTAIPSPASAASSALLPLSNKNPESAARGDDSMMGAAKT